MTRQLPKSYTCFWSNIAVTPVVLFKVLVLFKDIHASKKTHKGNVFVKGVIPMNE